MPEISAGSRERELPTITRQNRSLYAVVIFSLSLVMLIGVIGWLALAFSGRSMPEGLSNIVSMIVGGLLGVLVPTPPARD